MPPSINLNEFKAGIRHALEEPTVQAFEPTGLIEPMIAHVGEGKADLVCVIMANKCGKTAGWVNILGQMIWPSDNPFFNYPMFKNWPYRKKWRIATTAENAKEAGPIPQEIKQWWPKGRYTEDKAGRHHVSLYTSDTGWIIEVLTATQPQIEFEGPGLGGWVMDEPAKPWMIGAMNRGLERGGIGIVVFTPISMEGGYHPAPVLDIIEDLERGKDGHRGAVVKYVYGTMWENDTLTGKPNSRGTKRGFLTTKQIEDYAAKMPSSEREARLEGKLTFKSGRVYRGFDKSVHVSHYDIMSDYIRKTANIYMIADFHPKYYPAFIWVARTQDDKHIVVGEWPTFQTFNDFYDERRELEILSEKYDFDGLAELILRMDQLFSVRPPVRRWIDPRYAAANKNTFTGDKTLLSVVDEMAKRGVHFDLPPFEMIEVQRETIIKNLNYNTLMPISSMNQPTLYVNEGCLNVARCLEKHYWLDGKETEAEDYKDFVDLIRYYFAGLANAPWIDQVTPKKKEAQQIKAVSSFEQYKDIVGEVKLG